MPIPLLSIPLHIRDSIMQKMNLPDFVKFKRSSRLCLRDSEKIRTRFSIDNLPEYTFVDDTFGTLSLEYLMEGLWIQYSKEADCRYGRKTYHSVDLHKFPVRFQGFDVDIHEKFTEEFCVSLTQFVEESNSSINTLILREPDCTPDSLKELLESARVREVVFHKLISPEYLDVDAVRDISRFVISDRTNENEILGLNAPNFKISSSDLTSDGMNRILQQLVNGVRVIDYCSVQTSRIFRHADVWIGIPIASRTSFDGSDVVVFGAAPMYKLELDNFLGTTLITLGRI